MNKDNKIKKKIKLKSWNIKRQIKTKIRHMLNKEFNNKI